MSLRRSHLTFSVGLSVKGRESQRLDRCLESLEQQTLRPVQIVVVEMAEKGLFKHRATCVRFGVRHLQVEDDEGLFPLARLANIAGRQLMGSATHFVKTDMDAVFHPELLRQLALRVDEDPRGLVSVRPRRLLKKYSYPGGPERWCRDAQLVKGDEKMWGLCMAHDFDSFGELRGFDEAFVGWGGEDRNYVYRAEQAGRTARMLDMGPLLAHQWHSVEKGSRVNACKNKEWRKRAQRNGTGWGR